MVVAAFLVTDKVNQVKFFEKIFLVANVSPEVVFRILFFTLSNADIDFLNWKLRLKIYIIKEALSITRHIKLVGKKEFVLDLKQKIFVVHVVSHSSVILPSFSLLNVHPFHKPQVAGLIAEKALTKIPTKYLDFADIFSLDLVSKLSKHTKIKNHAIKLVDN